MIIGIISDTHDLLRPEVLERLRGCDVILHAGDISHQSVLRQLEQLAPVRAVRGNNDRDGDSLPEHLELELAGLRIYMAHKKKDLPAELSGYDIVVYGHSHQYSESWLDEPASRPGKRGRTLLLNPGSCGPRRFHQPVTIAMLTVNDDGWSVTRVDIPHSTGEQSAARPVRETDMRRVIETVIQQTAKGRSAAEIARRNGWDSALVEQIARLYVTHPGVTVDGIMTKLGL